MTIYEKPQNIVFAQDAPSSEIRPFEAWARGLGIAFEETNGYPELESFNGLLQALNSYIKYLEQNGFAEWSADLEYPIGAGVRVGNVWYKAKQQNTNKPPSTSQSDWSVFLNAGDLSYADPLQNVDGQIQIKDASTTQKGVVRFANATEVVNKSATQVAITAANAATVAQSTDLGVGQTWQNVSSQRASGQTYRNNTGKPIHVFIAVKDGVGGGLRLIIGGVTIFNFTYDLPAWVFYPVSIVIPNNTDYSFTWAGNSSSDLLTWSELR